MPTLEASDKLDAAGVVLKGASQRVGKFSFCLRSRRWECSDSVAVICGYQPGTVQLTAEMLLDHTHPDDRQQVGDVWDRLLRGEPCSSCHRLIDASGGHRFVVMVADGVRDDTGGLASISGFYVELTAALECCVTEKIAEWSAVRAEIEQAKGVLMATYGISAQRAFEVLVWRSQSTNVKLREFARRFLTAIDGTNSNSLGHVEHALLTAHGSAPGSPTCVAQRPMGTRSRKKSSQRRAR